MENLLDVYLKPGLKTVSLNLSVRDLCDVQGWVCQLPVGVSQLFLKFSTWLPVGVSIADGGIGELTLPVGLDRAAQGRQARKHAGQRRVVPDGWLGDSSRLAAGPLDPGLATLGLPWGGKRR
mmetsp:Transcript_5737/g.21802  ORF Transcript_5737/g.21802 Transcript_5737/m.21802 type:complete len:122 (+) Transcript_5737:474-839(+)